MAFTVHLNSQFHITGHTYGYYTRGPTEHGTAYLASHPFHSQTHMGVSVYEVIKGSA